MLLRHTEREEFKEFKEKPIWRYLPDVGLQFGLPSVQFRLSNYFQFKHDKHLMKAKLLAIDEKMQLEMNEQIQSLRIAYAKLELDFEKLQLAKGRLEYLERINKIDLECCRRNECTPEQCHKTALAYYQNVKAIKLKEMDCRIGVLEIKRMAKYDLPNNNFFK